MQQVVEQNPASATARPQVLVSRLTDKLFVPVLASLLRNRWFTFLLVGIGALQTGLVAAGLPGWICPIRATLNVRCPGCGLTTAIVSLLRGEWQTSLSTHAFAPIFLLGFTAMAVVSILPESLRQRTIHRIAALERRTGIVAFSLLGLVIYWGLRLIGLL